MKWYGEDLSREFHLSGKEELVAVFKIKVGCHGSDLRTKRRKGGSAARLASPKQPKKIDRIGCFGGIYGIKTGRAYASEVAAADPAAVQW
jgi:hypothetical protein